MQANLTSLVRRARIPQEPTALVFTSDGGVRAAQDGDEEDRVIEITTSHDMLPVPEDSPLRTWGAFSLVGYWLAEAFGISQYQVASSAVSAGLSPGATIGAVLLGHFVISLATAATGYIGCRYGINYPTLARTAFGVHGTYVAVICRAVAAIIWFGTQTYQGGQCVQVMLTAIWPSFARFPNHLPESAHVTSSMLLCFFIFYLIQLPLLWIHISKLKYLFAVKIVIMPIFGITLFGWAVGRAHGFGPVFSKPTLIKDGRPAGVVFMSAFTSAIGPKATLALNVCDFTRYAKSRRTVVWSNIFSLTFLVTLCAILGVVVTSATETIYGKATWNPLQVSSLMDSRAAQFFSALPWALSVLATNISANSTAVGNDLMVMLPKYINIRRGQYITALLGLVTCPWIIQNSAKTFTSFLGGYTIFLAPIGGILYAEYYVLRHRQLSLPDLFVTHRSCYWYTGGFNWRALVAFALGVVPSLPGFIRSINASLGIPFAAVYVYSAVYPVGVVVAGGIYLVLSYAFPPAALPSTFSALDYADSLGGKTTHGSAAADDKEKELGVDSAVVAA
ncbi:uncharacterized protein RHOBADRAFT_51725 [Rhodotorula graminis WP1]|uniref:Uncharacterized protein n=1 Tax=Rhodotorula graminis (strain WP1) TaxID=578459 RepID=A0A194SBE0_RHOGW|nr:uncharacterized protein RHOBADRAFT_51725 [Rhodotorula graminis WP1]KPV76726.1 hypothetical protein RHOBADRAFT_51725 [Rhodotorula graminis WP1]